MKTKFALSGIAAAMMLAAPALADNHMAGVVAANQSVAGGTVTAAKVSADANGWLVVHRTDASGKPGPVVGHAPIKAGMNQDVTAILTEPVAKGDMLMLMVHSEAGGMKTGIFEYTLGAKEDGPIKPGGKLVMKVVTAE